MPNVFPCPEPAELEQLVAGRRPSEEVERLAGHLEECHRCAATVDSLLADDTLVRNLAVHSAGLPAEEVTVVADLIRRLSELALLPAAVAETLTEPTTAEVARPEVAKEHYDFLSPAEGPGELGRLGGYRVLRVLGAGGMGVVFEAEDPQLKRLVALKVMRPALAASDSARQRFLREAQATAALEHDHIVAIYQVGQDRGAPFLAMPLLKGETLEDRLRGISDRGSRIADDLGARVQGSAVPASALPHPSSFIPHPSLLPLSETLRIGREMAAGLAAAHQRGLVHRDVKPANVWLEGTRRRVKLLDFGLARAQAGADGADAAQLTQEGGILGTPAYMSPEQAKGQPVDARSDLFSLGCVLYRLATGQSAFKGTDAVSTLVAITTVHPRPPREHNRELPASLSDLIMALLSKDRDERPASAQAVVEAIEAIEETRRADPLRGCPGVSPPVIRAHIRRRTWAIAAAAAAALLLAGIVVIVRDRSGNEIGRIHVPPGGNAETRESDDTKPSGDQASRPTARVPRRQPPVDSPRRPAALAPEPEIAPPLEIPEPPPLEEWLKGRTVLTVAQDGSGQFKTIQAALDALQSGEVVSVLDRGPYRERLVLEHGPPNTGLINQQGAVIELSEWKLLGKDERGDIHQGHVLWDIDGFRLHGFDFVFPEDIEIGDRLHVLSLGGLVIEQCRFQDLPNETWNGHSVSLVDHDVDGRPHSFWVRGCAIDGYLEIHAKGKNEVMAVIEQNEFDSIHCDHHIHFHADAWKQVVVRHNVFRGKAELDVLVNQGWKPSATLEVTNNTSTTKTDLVVFQASAEHGNVTVRNNVHTSPRLIRAMKGADEDLAAAQRNWRVDHNIYPTGSPEQSGMTDNVVPRSPADVPTTPQFLSKNPANADYLRIAADSLPATAGAGGDWPSYVGALAPGPAPKDGDWFTHLRECWRPIESDTPAARVADISAPVEVPEPPPLEEWLNDREVLTVAQDGSGRFKTIQAALDALKTGQVVEVLDRGPYRESLRLVQPPEDTGLVSRCDTLLEVVDWTRPPEDENTAVYGHHFYDARGFRLSGFSFLCGSQKDALAQAIWVNPADLVIEGCQFDFTTDSKPDVSIRGLKATWWKDLAEPVIVRDCTFNMGGFQGAGGPRCVGPLMLSRNYFRRGAAIQVVNDFRQVVIRENVLDTGDMGVQIHNLRDPLASLEISNNTFYKATVNAFDRCDLRQAVICNNVFAEGIHFWGDTSRDLENCKTWQAGHNCYTRRGSLPKSATDMIAEPNFLSVDPADRNFLRTPADGSLSKAGAGGDWPTYLGALPPGPAPATGDWFTRLQERWQAAATKTATVKPADIPPPLQVPEPPPLEEWLKGRTVLTVAQDGSGQFKTIQSALDALQSGEVVSVLDRGPYRERLVLEGVPRDTGLISEMGTVIELSEWKFARKARKEESGDLYLGHVLSGTDGFRLHGFEMVFPEEINWGYRLHVRRTGGLVLEYCQFRDLSTSGWDGHLLKIENQEEDEGPPLSVWVRHCLIEGYLDLAAEGRADVTVVVERNCFTSGRADHHLRFYGEAWDQVCVRHNIFRGRADHDLLIDGGWKPSSVLEVTNNTTTTGIDLVVFAGTAQQGSVTVRNNLRTASRLLAVLGGTENDRAFAQSHWRVDHNAYPDVPPAEPWREENQVPRSPADVPIRPRFLSKDPANPDYLRISTDSPLATAGAGGDWSNYVGALPPGPAPKDGDWFTRLREQLPSAEQKTTTAKVADFPAPAQVPEPPPLEEWLKDREVLTVSQDGSGQFKTIQSALDALQPGQVIKVLDFGPYRERLDMEDVPADTGLVSEKMTVLDLPAYQLHYKDSDHEYFKGHYFRDMDGFRIAGFTLSFPERPNEPSYGLQTHRGGGFVLERCWLRSPVEAIVGYHAGGSTKLSCVRECRIDGILHVGSLDNDQAATLITRNLFFGEHGVAHVGLDCVYKYVGVRNNVFANPHQGLEVHPPKQLARLEINNNTFLGRNPVFFVRSLPPGEVVVCNNLRLRAGLLALVGGAEDQRDEVMRDWLVGFNCYPRELAPDDWPKEQLVPRFPNDILATPRFVSKVAGEPDYLRPAADDPIARAGAGGAWPDYIGALPPGPAPKDGDWFTRLQSLAGMLD